MAVSLSYRGRSINDTDVAFIRELIAQHPMASRRQLSQELCRAWHWVQPNGALRDMVCRGLMLQLHRAGHIELPPVRQRPPNPLAQRERPEPVPVDRTPLCGRLRELGPLSFCQVRRTGQEKLFNALVEQHHYLGYTQPVGEHLKYLVHAQGRPVAALAWCSAPHGLTCRDRFIGWSAQVRRPNIRFLAYNSRFLILPWVRVEHLASHVLGRMARRVADDWQRIYGHGLYFLETFVDPQRYRGTCYRAANWQVLGETTGRGHNCPTDEPNRPIKQVLGYPLTKRFRQFLSDSSTGRREGGRSHAWGHRMG
jgi:hypothetical protein